LENIDYGATWENVSDGYFATGSIGAIRVSESHPDIVYVGTGSDGIRSNVIIGKGVYRSDDAGKTWNFLGLKDAGQIGAVEIHPTDPDICFVAAIGNPFGPNAARGVFKTTDGGKSWKKVLYLSDSTGICDLEFAPGNPDVLYASGWTVCRKPWTIISGSTEGGVYKSTDGGESWDKLTNGLPQGIVGKSDLAICPAKPANLYVLMEAADGQGGLFLSEDYGSSFTRISDRPSLLDRPFYYTNVDVDPVNPNVIHVNSTAYYQSDDMGKTWERKSTPHGDNHDLWINPANTAIRIQSNDGGANVTRDGGETWSTQDNQPTAELYQVNVDDQFIYWLYAGQQDNSTVAIPSSASVGGRRGVPAYMAVGGCETGPAVPKPGNPNIVYSNCKGLFSVFDKTTGIEKKYYVGGQNMYGHNPKDLKYRFQRVSPIMVSRHNPDVVYHCSQYVHKTTDDGVTWETISPDLTANEPDKQVISGGPITRDVTGEEFYSTLYAIEESPLQEGVIWVGANDGPVHVTRDGGKTWINVTPAGLPPGGRVQNIEPSPHDPAKAYLAVYRYLLNDWRPYIYMTDDYGKTWKHLTPGNNGIPADHPTRVVREDPGREGLLFAGTEFGLFISFNDGASWQSFQQNLPVVPVTDMRIHRNDLILSTMGRSFWILGDIAPLHHLDAMQSKPANRLFPPSAAYRSPATRGANLDYYLADSVEGARLEIIGEAGKVVRKLRISGQPGFHRVGWDLRTEGDENRSFRRGSSGFSVVPGTYTVRLTADTGSFEEAIEVLPDPRLTAQGMTIADYREQYDLCLKVMKLQSEARQLTRQVDTLWSPLKKKADAGEKISRKEKRILDDLLPIRNMLVTASGPYPQPMLNDQIGYLFSMISSTDQKPGRDAWIRLEELTRLLEEIQARFGSVQ
jgi:photosystem II stability/assembly factor-like uncharacterized protein